jgi:outer membrane receptor protein involved in Fe transport
MKRYFSMAVAVRILTGTLALLLACVPMFAQGSTGRISGTVTDQSGGGIAGATVAVKDVNRGVTQNLITDSDGAYFAANLVPGTYTVHAEFKGFKAFERQNILVEVGKEVRVDVTLQTGATSEKIVVTEDVPMVDTSSTTLGGTINNEIINDLPLNGRNYQNLISLRPGTIVAPGGGPWSQSTNGIRPEDTSYIVDGITNDEAFMGLSVTNAAAVIGDAATLLPIDAIQEFNTQVNPKAEFGWKPGAVTSVGLKSGTNSVHGTAYAFGRKDSWDARNYFNPAIDPSSGLPSEKTPVALEQYGGTVGGRIIRDKLFYFAGYEGQMYTVGNSIPVNVPTTVSIAAGGGAGCSFIATGNCKKSIVDATNDLIAGGYSVAPLSTYLAGLYAANATQDKGITVNFPNVNSSKNLIGKVDYHLNDHNSLSGSYFFGNDTLVGMDFPQEVRQEFLTKLHSRAQDVSGTWTWAPNSTWVNELRGGYTHYTLQILPNNLDIPYTINTGITNPLLQGFPNVKISGMAWLGPFKNFPKIVGPDKVLDFIDQVSYLRGKHAIKFGGEIRNDAVHQATYRGGRGLVYFLNGSNTFDGSTGLEDFLAGNPDSADFLAGDTARNLNQKLFAGFAQDDWRITPRVTLNLGVRYEYRGVPSEANNLLGNFEPSVGLEQVGVNIPSVYNGDHKNFSPRFGVAWDVTGKGTTILRAGGSIIYSLLSMNTFLSQQNLQNSVTLGLGTIPTGAKLYDLGTCLAGCAGPGTITSAGISIPGPSLTWTTTSAQIYPSNVSSFLECGNPTPCNTFSMDRNFKTPYVENWMLGVQHSFSSKISLDLSYVGNHAVKLTGVRDLNQPYAGGAPSAIAAQYPYLGNINYLSNQYGSAYHGLQTTLTARNYRGLDFVVGYTYSHGTDYQSSNWVALLPQDSYNLRAEHGSSDYDIRHRLTLSLTYSLPEKKTKTQLLEGWQVNTILTLQSGMPWNVNDQTYNIANVGENSDRWNFSGNPADFKSAGSDSIPFCTGPGLGGCSYMTAGGLVPVPLSAAQSSTLWTACTNAAPDAGTLASYGCYASLNGASVMVPPVNGTFGTMGRNIFRDTAFRNVDLSISKSFKFGEKLKAQFRAEAFNALNHPMFANPTGGAGGWGLGAFSDPSAGPFGCGCGTPDTAAVNPVLGSGGARAIQLGLKFIF